MPPSIGNVVRITIMDDFWQGRVGSSGGFIERRGRPGLKIAAWFEELEDILQKPTILNGAIRGMGQYLSLNFREEGGTQGRRWQSLSETTRRLREERGYNPEHPILQQTGTLFRVSARSFANWDWGKVTGSASGTGVRMAASTSASPRGMTFHATISGPKVDNQFGKFSNFFGWSETASASRYGRGYLPQRRFWFINPDMADLMTHATSNVILSDWASSQRGTGIAGWTNPAYLNLPRGRAR